MQRRHALNVSEVCRYVFHIFSWPLLLSNSYSLCLPLPPPIRGSRSKEGQLDAQPKTTPQFPLSVVLSDRRLSRLQTTEGPSLTLVKRPFQPRSRYYHWHTDQTHSGIVEPSSLMRLIYAFTLTGAGNLASLALALSALLKIRARAFSEISPFMQVI